ncbi:MULTISPECIES: urease accessory protein UreD [unclassified Amycolatopsis]|uniref:urease accessory protein UreD n=1 Tax=unclassified Amycolatopsis TaxID=2618356 RepID=UPI001C6A6077|nr:urease accessory protein UreD [Amycolatopsis sp. DSM 110486]QYN23339.1 urease accessory protein UreD [Amycolatopsis sp. DSM 110486]
MKAHARVVACFEDGRTVLRELRSMAPLTLFPRRRTGRQAVVHLVSSATAPLGGDELLLDVRVGPGAELRLSGVAATLALPGPSGGRSSSTVDIEVADGGSLAYLPEPTVVTARADHVAVLHARLGENSRFHTREVLVLGRAGERPGRLTTSTHVLRGGVPLLRQTQTIGDPALDGGLAVLAGKRVLATDLEVGFPARPTASGDWWACTSPAVGVTLTTALAEDAVVALRLLP